MNLIKGFRECSREIVGRHCKKYSSRLRFVELNSTCKSEELRPCRAGGAWPISHLRQASGSSPVVSSFGDAWTPPCRGGNRAVRRVGIDPQEPSVSAPRLSRGMASRPSQEGARFRVSDSVELALHIGDITQWFVDGKTDAIVNAANPRMLGGGGVDGAIHRRAGPLLREACWKIPEVHPDVRCPIGEARVTEGFNLPVSRVIHTVGPVYYDHETSAPVLHSAYRNSLMAAIENGIKYVAFSAISCGVYGYPVEEAAGISLSAIKEASEGLSEIHFVLFTEELYNRWFCESEKQFTKL